MIRRCLTTIALIGMIAANASAASFNDYTTCAVYFRMQVGHFKSRDLTPIADIEQEKMDRMVTQGRKAAIAEFDDEEMFDIEWRTILAEMTDEINRNYENISRIKYRYDERCEALLETLP